MDPQTDAARHSLARLITSFHILHHHNILNEAGTISIRNPSNPATFITSNHSAISVSSPADLSELYVNDGSPVQRAVGRVSYPPSHHSNSEIYIHSCLYAKYPGVHSIVHSPAVDFIVYSLCDAKGSMSRAVFNRAGFVDEYNPTFDPTQFRSSLPATHPLSLQIDHPILGNALAESLITSTNGVSDEQSIPEHGVAFIRGNGAVIWNDRLEEAVFKAISLQRNAAIQTAAMLQRADSQLEITYLTPTEAAHCHRASKEAVLSAWGAWATEVLRTPLYRNDLSDFVSSAKSEWQIL
jgi:ribulose-5-phosphate 4-epimerase/fuculose-1-phosphate aldolase